MNLTYVVSSIVKNRLWGSAWKLFSNRGNLGMDGLPEIKLKTLRAYQDLLSGTQVKINGGSIVELGVGRTPDLMIAFALCGAERVAGLDVDEWLGEPPVSAEKIAAVKALLAQLDSAEVLGSPVPASDEAALDHARRVISYQRYDGTMIPFETSSVDLIYSKSVMEHVRKRGVPALLAEQFRILRPHGHVCHIIDLRDHCHLIGDEDEQGDWLDALRYSERLHNLMTDHRPAYINRLRAEQWKREFEAAGFEIVRADLRRRPLHESFDVKRLDSEFRETGEDFSIAWIDIVARKAATA